MAVKRCEECGGGGYCKVCKGYAEVKGKECPECDGAGYCLTCDGFGKLVDVEASNKAKEKKDA